MPVAITTLSVFNSIYKQKIVVNVHIKSKQLAHWSPSPGLKSFCRASDWMSQCGRGFCGHPLTRKEWKRIQTYKQMTRLTSFWCLSRALTVFLSTKLPLALKYSTFLKSKHSNFEIQFMPLVAIWQGKGLISQNSKAVGFREHFPHTGIDPINMFFESLIFWHSQSNVSTPINRLLW